MELHDIVSSAAIAKVIFFIKQYCVVLLPRLCILEALCRDEIIQCFSLRIVAKVFIWYITSRRIQSAKEKEKKKTGVQCKIETFRLDFGLKKNN